MSMEHPIGSDLSTKMWFRSEPGPLGAATSAQAGLTVALVQRDEGERIEVRDGRRRLVLTVDPLGGRIVVESPEGDVAFAAPRGAISLEARDGVRVASPTGVTVTAGEGAAAASLAMGPGRAHLGAPAVDVDAARAMLAVGEASWVGKRLRAKVEDVVVVAERCERIASRVFERAKSVFSTVEDLHQTKAGRVRTLVRGAWALHSDHTTMTSDEEIKIDGKAIRLG